MGGAGAATAGSEPSRRAREGPQPIAPRAEGGFRSGLLAGSGTAAPAFCPLIDAEEDMDRSVHQIAAYASSLQFDDLPPPVVHDCKRKVIDTLGCGLAAFDAEPSRIVRKLALRTRVPSGASVLGTGEKALPELAAFANGVMMRYLDGNDTYPGGGGHPSDCIAAILAIAEAMGCDGKTVITAITLAYEIHHNLNRTTNGSQLRTKGWDHVLYPAISSAVGAAKVMGLGHDGTAQAVSLAIVPNLALEATRRGSLSMWKGCAAGNAVRNGLFAALLAAEGLTGPDKPIEGPHGLWDIIGKFELAEFAGEGRPFRITEASLKCFLSEYHSQAPITAALQLHSQVAIEDIASIVIDTYWFAWSEIGSEPEKWHPATRETADHSMPFIVAAVLIDGAFSDEIFSEARLRNWRVHQLADKISVRENAELTRRFPEMIPCHMEITLKNGRRVSTAVDYPRGHYKNPMTDDEVAAKFRGLAGRVLPAPSLERALGQLWKLDSASTLNDIFSALRTDA